MIDLKRKKEESLTEKEIFIVLTNVGTVKMSKKEVKKDDDDFLKLLEEEERIRNSLKEAPRIDFKEIKESME